MENRREEAVLGGLGMCLGITLALFLPAPTIGIPIFSLVAAVAGMGIAVMTECRFHCNIPQRLDSIQQALQYSRVYRL